VVFPTLSVLASLGSTVRRRPWNFALPLAFISLVPAVLALARPVMRRESPDRTPSGIDIVIALDVSLSMEIPDFKRPGSINGLRRIDAAKAVVEQFIDRRPDDRIGLVAFSGRPYSVSPITLDHDWVTAGLRRLRLGDLEEQGTAIGSAVAAAATRLDARDSKSKIVVLVTDGSNNSGKLDPVEAAELASRLSVRVYTVAIGTEEGRVSLNTQRFPRQEFDVETLQKIAAITGAEFYRARDIGSLESTFATIDRLETSTAETGRNIEQTELFPWFAGAAMIASLAAAVVYALNPPAGH
jgi:Ca-activated chloride channel family protein